MFSTEKPTIAEFLSSYKDGGVGVRDQYIDVHEGSIFEIVGGTAAILWSKEVQRDEDIFADIFTDTADGDALTDRIRLIYGVDRYLDTSGTGTASISRPTVSGGGGTLWEGTRVAVYDRSGLAEPTILEVAADTFIDATATLATVPVRSVKTGNDAIVATLNGTISPRFDDIVWDTTWRIDSLTCDVGTKFEPAAELRARARQTRLDQRLGFAPAILAACRRAGAGKVALFAADYAGTSFDSGMNYIYVADSGYRTTAKLLGDCMLELEKTRILGDNMQVRPMQSVALAVSATVYLIDTPTKFNRPALIQRLQKTIAASLDQDFSYSLDGFRGGMFKSSTEVQDAEFAAPTVDGTILTTVNGYPAMPGTLTRYTLRPENIIIQLSGPR